jgi:hypothetical protein
MQPVHGGQVEMGPLGCQPGELQPYGEEKGEGQMTSCTGRRKERDQG